MTDRAASPDRPEVRVVVTDDHNVVRAGLVMLLESQDAITVLGDASSGEAAIRLLDELFAGSDDRRPNVVVMDLMMKGIGGLEATRRIKQDWPGLGVLILTMAEDRGYLREAFAAGASGYVLKEAAGVELAEAVRTVAEGGRYLHPSLGAELASATEEASTGPKTTHGVPLTRREVDVLRLVASGYVSREIGEQLYISVRTVETHKTHVMQKTGLHTRAELTRFAHEAGILDLDE